MNKSLAVGLVIGSVAATTVGAVAGYRVITAPSGAEVISAKALTKTIKTPRQECHDEQVTHTKEAKDKERLVGTGVGAVVGGLLGSRIGGGNTRIFTGLAGAAAGGYAGNKIEQKVQKGDTETTTEKRCVTVYDAREEPNGYEVVYILDGKRHHVHMDHDPGKKIPVHDGQIVVETTNTTLES
ncbi:MAG: 17 kDa surface antigen [Gammaproteobacteria bacterium]|nr:17 kDa surface antigen [Gammaproteobacteria bacterium]